ncbi:dihydrofolate reductase family protein [Cryobacterium sp. PH31-AA6]|uniref:dihydrofolate reductase family protein n=1 Tax=Cryobacterium sp. PH31-AA6 TaxID=3046205 RepID=UPI0024B91AE9|nr:dihydrofolate reductase family protein [Cryobacterium sp. PH31-AA6]MDJ0322322.1 dihydrofolate reductase family protein [Cryobacterium sp. PH31-AA6]
MTTPRTWTGHVFIATSVDGYIARPDGGLDWLTDGPAPDGDGGYSEFTAAIDHLLMGRGTYETVAAFDPWPYSRMRVVVLSSTLSTDDDRVTVVRSLDDAVDFLTDAGAERVYVDGGRVITSCLAAGLIDDLVITRVPVLLGAGLPLFGALPADVRLESLAAAPIGGGMVQERYTVVR